MVKKTTTRTKTTRAGKTTEKAASTRRSSRSTTGGRGGRGGRGRGNRVSVLTVPHTLKANPQLQTGKLIAPPRYHKGSMRIIPLGGLGEIGRNMSVVEYNGHLLLLDCGVLFPRETQPGVDAILPDFNYILDRLDDIDALALTHGHEDHIGAVPYLLSLRSDIPVIGSKLTLALVDAKCEEYGQHPTEVVVEGRDKLKVGPFDLEFINVTHSIPDAMAISVRTPGGSLIDTGDFKMDQMPLDGEVTDLQELGRLGEEGVDLLMIDSTNSEVPGFVKPEVSIAPDLERAFAQARQKTIVVSFSSHIHRIQQAVDMAHRFGRKVVFSGRSMIRNMQIASDLGYLHLPDNTVVDIKKAHDYPDNKLTYICRGSQGEPLAALGRIADDAHRDITAEEGDTVIMCCSLIPGNEPSVYKVTNKLIRKGVRVVDRNTAAIHVSGHGDAGELLFMYNVVRPKCAMPIHGESRHLDANSSLAVKTGISPENVVLSQNGDVVDLYHGHAAVVGSVPCGYVYVDGAAIGTLSDEDLEKRRALGAEGTITAVAVVDTASSEVISGPTLYASLVSEEKSALKPVIPQIVRQLQDAMMTGTRSTVQLQQIMRRALGSWLSRELNRSPLIVPVVTDLANDTSSPDGAWLASGAAASDSD